MEGLRLRGYGPAPDGPLFPADMLRSLPAKLRGAQRLFETTGGLHAAGLFTAAGDLVALREDVGRHNAVDKLIGWAFMENKLPWPATCSWSVDVRVSSSCRNLWPPGPRAVLRIGPSSLAVELAREFGLTLVGFLREERFKVYSGEERAGLA